jgi:hypothetical protein
MNFENSKNCLVKEYQHKGTEALANLSVERYAQGVYLISLYADNGYRKTINFLKQ